MRVSQAPKAVLIVVLHGRNEYQWEQAQERAGHHGQGGRELAPALGLWGDGAWCVTAVWKTQSTRRNPPRIPAGQRIPAGGIGQLASAIWLWECTTAGQTRVLFLFGRVF